VTGKQYSLQMARTESITSVTRVQIRELFSQSCHLICQLNSLHNTERNTSGFFTLAALRFSNNVFQKAAENIVEGLTAFEISRRAYNDKV